MEACLHRIEPLKTFTIDLSKQDPILAEHVFRNICVQDTLDTIAETYIDEESIECEFRRASHNLADLTAQGMRIADVLSPHKDYAFSVRGPILQFSPIGGTSTHRLEHLGGCKVEKLCLLYTSPSPRD